MTAQHYALAAFIVMFLILAAFAFIVVKKVAKMDLASLVCEIKPDGTPGKASLSRFQMLLFTFLVGGLFVVLSLESGTMIDIPTGVLGLIGISGGSYLISKGLSPSAPAAPGNPTAPAIPAAPKTPEGGGDDDGAGDDKPQGK